MSTPIFDTLYAESDETTRALVWDAVRPATVLPDSDLGAFIDQMNTFARAIHAIQSPAEPCIEVSQ